MDNGSGGRAQGNRILERLPLHDRTLVAAVVETVGLEPGEVLGSAGKKSTHVFFSREGAISLFASASGAPMVGVGVIDRAGMFGLSLAAGRPSSPISATSQGHGRVDRIEARDFLGVLGKSAGLREALLAYGESLSSQMARNTACALSHAAHRRLARWMLDVTPGSRDGRFASTQADTATAIGVQRQALSRAAGTLQRLGLISYVRGDVTILDRQRLKAVACACSAPLRVRSDRVHKRSSVQTAVSPTPTTGG